MGRMRAMAEEESGGSRGGKGDKRHFPREKRSLLTAQQMVRDRVMVKNRVMMKDRVMARNPRCQAGGFPPRSGRWLGSEPSPHPEPCRGLCPSEAPLGPSSHWDHGLDTARLPISEEDAVGPGCCGGISLPWGLSWHDGDRGR